MFSGGTAAILYAHLHHPPQPPIAIDPSLPRILNDVILRAVAKDPDDRFHSAAEFREALAQVDAADWDCTNWCAPPVEPPPSVEPAPIESPPVIDQPSATAPPVLELPSRTRRRWLWFAIPGSAVMAVITAIQANPAWRTPRRTGASIAVTEHTSRPPITLPKSDLSSARKSRPPAGALVSTPVVGAQARPPANPIVTPLVPQPSAAPSQPGGKPTADVPTPAETAEMHRFSEDLSLVNARAASIRSSLDNLRLSLQAGGGALAGDIQSSATRLDQ
jgi:serine/threonine-protein kinase